MFLSVWWVIWAPFFNTYLVLCWYVSKYNSGTWGYKSSNYATGTSSSHSPTHPHKHFWQWIHFLKAYLIVSSVERTYLYTHKNVNSKTILLTKSLSLLLSACVGGHKYSNLAFCAGIIFFNRVEKNNNHLFEKWLDLITRPVKNS